MSADEYLAECRARQTMPQVNELAARLQLAVSKFSNCFLDDVGERPSKYLKRRHVLDTIAVIKQTNLDYSTIARMMGYGSRTTLYRSIRRVTGRTPQSFRRK